MSKNRVEVKITDFFSGSLYAEIHIFAIQNLISKKKKKKRQKIKKED